MTRRGRQPPLPSASDWGPSVPEVLPRAGVARYVVTRKVDKVQPDRRRKRFQFGWVEVAPNHRLVDPNGTVYVLDARDKVVSYLDCEFVESYEDLQEAKRACSRYNDVQEVMDS